jgi:hypothetical protein
MWWNAPVAPTFDGERFGWRLQESTLVFYGGMLALNLKW